MYIVLTSPQLLWLCTFFFFSSRRRHTRCSRDWSSDVCSSDLVLVAAFAHFGTNIERSVGGPLVKLGFLRRARLAPALFRWNDHSQETQSCGHHGTHRREAFFEQGQSSPRFRSAN